MPEESADAVAPPWKIEKAWLRISERPAGKRR
jgi:hypothetical protein